MMSEDRLLCAYVINGDEAAVRLQGRLAADSVIQLAELFQQVRRQQINRILLDLRGLTALDPAGFAFLKASHRYFNCLAIDFQPWGLTPEVGRQAVQKSADRDLLSRWQGAPRPPASADAETPANIETEKERMMISGQPQQPPAPQVCMLIVDDEELVLNFIAAFLKANGYAVLLAQTAAEALAHLAAHRDRLQFALVDLTLREGSGLDLTEDLARLHPSLKMALTSGVGHDSLVQLNNPRGLKILRKPFRGEQLLAFIRQELAG